jgi:hypothetical protein
MENQETPENALPCPGCGEPMQWMPALDGSGDIAICPSCSSESTPLTDQQSEGVHPPDKEKETDPASKFRKILSETGEQPSPAELPEDMLEDLPEEARNLLTRKSTPKPDPTSEELSEHIASSLRDQGYVISHDGHGVRISGELSSSRADPTPMSPYDIVRIAADLEGGVVPPEKRRNCTKCEAVIPIGDDHCQMCGEPAPSEPEPSE